MHGRGSSSSGIQLSGSDSNISINSVELGPSSKHLNTINESEKENIQRLVSLYKGVGAHSLQDS